MGWENEVEVGTVFYSAGEVVERDDFPKGLKAIPEVGKTYKWRYRLPDTPFLDTQIVPFESAFPLQLLVLPLLSPLSSDFRGHLSPKV
jgi:hypothetical protein